ncbi:MAG: hypothetical protein CSA15_07325 [Candidatus Delongbacteria bacterium]|nr:MAG: hypothetical protein CSA15_07325 [Candidatus Delongbacteria bacterium]
MICRILFILFAIVLLFGKVSKNDSTIVYSANHSNYLRNGDENILILSGDSKLEYQDFTLTADTIRFNSKKGLIYASYSLDSVFTDGVLDSVRIIGLPTFTEGDEVVTGKSMVYDVNKRIGKVTKANSVIKNKKPKNNLFVKASKIYKHPNSDISGVDGYVTGCPKEDNPHYSFRTDSMIMTKDNWVYIKPVVFYIHKVPLLYAPFAFYKKSSGRSSGIILPSYTYSSYRGNGFKNLGFFWDISEFLDYTAYLEYSDFSGFLLTQDIRFRERYKIEGNLKATYLNNYSEKNFRIESNYNQIFTPTTKLRFNIDYTSKTDLVKKIDYSESDRLKNYLTSGGNFYKKWRNSGDNLSITSSYKQYLDTGMVNFTMPNLNYTFSTRTPGELFNLKSKALDKIKIGGSIKYKRNGNFNTDLNNFTDKNSLTLSLSESYKFDKFKLSGSHNYLLEYDKFKLRTIDSYGNNSYIATNRDSLYHDYGFKTSYSLSYKHSILKYLKLEESATVSNDYAGVTTDHLLNEYKDWKSRLIYNLSASANTSIYGIFQPEIFLLKKMRHTIYPKVKLTYHPNFTDKKYGYYETYIDSNGVKREYDKFSKSIVGATPGRESFKYDFSLSNIFDLKLYKNLDKKDSYEHKFLKHTLSFSYDQLKDSLNFSPLSSKLNLTFYNGKLYYYNFSSKTMQKLPLISMKVEGFLNNSFSFYDKDGSWIGFDNYLLRKTNEKYGYNISIPISYKGNISSTMFQDSESKEKDLIRDRKANFSDISIDYSGSIKFNQSFGDRGYNRTFTLSNNLTIEPTENWKFTYKSSFNFDQPKVTTSSSIVIFRKIHCFEGKFEWDINRLGYKIEIRATNDLFRDLKWEKDTTRSRWYR